MNFNEKTSRANFNNLITYLMKSETSHIEIKRISPNYDSEPKNLFQITIHSPQSSVDSNFIKNNFNLFVRKFTEIWDNGKLYTPGIDPYDKDLEHSHIWVEIID